MPYVTIEDLPKNVRKHLPIHAQEMYKQVFNYTWQECLDDQKAFNVAWSAIRKQYEKNRNGFWNQKEAASEM